MKDQNKRTYEKKLKARIRSKFNTGERIHKLKEEGDKRSLKRLINDQLDRYYQEEYEDME